MSEIDLNFHSLEMLNVRHTYRENLLFYATVCRLHNEHDQKIKLRTGKKYANSKYLNIHWHSIRFKNPNLSLSFSLLQHAIRSFVCSHSLLFNSHCQSQRDIVGRPVKISPNFQPQFDLKVECPLENPINKNLKKKNKRNHSVFWEYTLLVNVAHIRTGFSQSERRERERDGKCSSLSVK